MAEIDNKKEIYIRALRLKGLDNQLNITLEELAELIQAIIKYKRVHEKYDTEVVIDHLCEEVADVEIMLEQMRCSFNQDFSNRVDIYKEQKLDRFKRILDRIESEKHD